VRISCGRCGIEHELDELEPSYARPDVVHALPAEVRAVRARMHEDWCVLDEGGAGARYFLRVLLPIAVHGKGEPCCWGLWTEVSRSSYDEVRRLWNDATQAQRGPWTARLANQIPGYPPTLDLPGTLRFVDPAQIPHFDFSPEVGHPLALERRNGVDASRVTDWLLHSVHHDERWPFDQAPNVGAITTQTILDGAPIRFVVHYADDDSWAFLTGEPFDENEGRLIAMESALRLDPTLRAIADLPPGWVASRSAVGAQWTREPDSEN
jgi:hypothetical protein